MYRSFKKTDMRKVLHSKRKKRQIWTQTMKEKKPEELKKQTATKAAKKVAKKAEKEMKRISEKQTKFKEIMRQEEVEEAKKEEESPEESTNLNVVTAESSPVLSSHNAKHPFKILTPSFYIPQGITYPSHQIKKLTNLFRYQLFE